MPHLIIVYTPPSGLPAEQTPALAAHLGSQPVQGGSNAGCVPATQLGDGQALQMCMGRVGAAAPSAARQTSQHAAQLPTRRCRSCSWHLWPACAPHSSSISTASTSSRTRMSCRGSKRRAGGCSGGPADGSGLVRARDGDAPLTGTSARRLPLPEAAAGHAGARPSQGQAPRAVPRWGSPRKHLVHQAGHLHHRRRRLDVAQHLPIVVDAHMCGWAGGRMSACMQVGRGLQRGACSGPAPGRGIPPDAERVRWAAEW